MAKRDELHCDDAVIRNRIVEIREVRGAELKRNEKNWRRHPERQTAALSAIIEEVGIAGVLLAYERDGDLVLLDGHARVDIAPDAMWHVAILDVDEDEADYLLASIDGITTLAEADQDALRDLLQSIETESAAVQEVFDAMIPDDPPVELDSIADQWIDEERSTTDTAAAARAVAVRIEFPARVWLVAEQEITDRLDKVAREYGGSIQ